MRDLKYWQLNKLNKGFLGKSKGLMRLLEKGEISTSLEIKEESNDFKGIYQITINDSLNFFKKFWVSSYVLFKVRRKGEKSGNTYSYLVCLPTKDNHILKLPSDVLKRICDLDLDEATKRYQELSQNPS